MRANYNKCTLVTFVHVYKAIYTLRGSIYADPIHRITRFVKGW